jgi:hypothetical protein
MKRAIYVHTCVYILLAIRNSFLTIIFSMAVEGEGEGSWQKHADDIARDEFENRALLMANAQDYPLCKRLLRDFVCVLSFRGQCTQDAEQTVALRAYYGGLLIPLNALQCRKSLVRGGGWGLWMKKIRNFTAQKKI